MREKARGARRVRWLAALLGAFVLALSVMPVTAWAAGGAVYVSESGSDTTGDGSQGNPYETLAKAVVKAEDGDTVYVTADQEIGKIIWVGGKSITITGSLPMETTRLCSLVLMILRPVEIRAVGHTTPQ